MRIRLYAINDRNRNASSAVPSAELRLRSSVATMQSFASGYARSTRVAAEIAVRPSDGDSGTVSQASSNNNLDHDTLTCDSDTDDDNNNNNNNTIAFAMTISMARRLVGSVCTVLHRRRAHSE